MDIRTDIREELETHLRDCEDSLISDGVHPRDAHTRAVQLFGELHRVELDVAREHQRQSLWSMRAIIVGMVFLAIAISLGYWLRSYPLTGALFQPVMLSILYLGIFALVLVLIRWMVEFWGLNSKEVLLFSLLFSLLINVSITAIYDIDKVLVPIQAILVGSLLLAVVITFWNSLSVFARRVAIYGFAIFAIWTAIHGQATISFLGLPSCIYLTRDAVPLSGELAQCKEMPFFYPLLWPVYAVIISALFVTFHFLKRYVASAGTFAHRKIVMTTALALVPLLPLAVHDVNNYGKIDVISWKPAIYQSYHNILDRDPQPKDMDFYAYTRSYQNIKRVEAVLYASQERRIKINLLHQEILHRDASEAEMDFFIQSRMTVTDIRTKLQSHE
ncbi:MAG: hypothetical protein WC289_01045 [Patescibacteria group bacterium]|jgi:hypothetical protein